MTTRETAFFGKNSRTTDVLFHSKRLYYINLRDESEYLDLWYTKPLYGKVDTNFHMVYPSITNLKELVDNRGETSGFALNFVADAFNTMNIYLQNLGLRKKLNENSFFYPLAPKKSWIDTNDMYQGQLNMLYDSFSKKYAGANYGKINKQIKSFDTFLPLFREFLNIAVKDFPVTKSGFVSRTYYPYLASGLVIEIAEENDYSDDPKKYSRYFNDPQFATYLKIVNQFGFYVDMNVPWRLIANLGSPAWQVNTKLKEIVDSYFEEGYTIQNVFDKFYYKPHLIDLKNLKITALQFYNSLVDEIPVLHEPKVCEKSLWTRTRQGNKVRGKATLRRKTTLENLERKYDDLYWNKLYLSLRIKELGLNLSDHQMNHELREIEQRYNVMGSEITTEYIADRVGLYLQEQLKRIT